MNIETSRRARSTSPDQIHLSQVFHGERWFSLQF